MGIKMKLFLVTCCGGWNSSSTIDVYVIAGDETTASDMALKKMRELSYLYTSFVSQIKLIASTETYLAHQILIMD